MTYYDYPMGWECFAKKSGEDLRAYTLRAFRQSEKNGDSGMANQVATEYLWYKEGKPYYKVDNAAIELFKRVNIDVPFKYVVAPFKQFAVRFPEDNKLRTTFGPVRSLLVLSLTPGQVREEVAKDIRVDHLCNTGMLGLWVDTGERRANGMPVMNYVIMHRCDDIPISESLKLLPVHQHNEIEHIVVELLSIVVSVCFLSTSSDKIIKPDVLSKDLGAYIEAERRQNTDRIRVMTERAHRKGKIGYIVDGERELVHSGGSADHCEPTGRHLSYRHMRSAHFRRFPSGVVKLIRQHLVRPDLPAREI